MGNFTSFYDYGLWISLPVLGLGVFLLWRFIGALVKLGRKNRICTLPLEDEQAVEFAEAGRVILWLEGPLLTTRFAKLGFELAGADGAALEGRRVLFRQRSSGLSKVRITDRVFTIPRPGHYVLRAKGLNGQKTGDEKHRLVFMRPYLIRTVGCILGILSGAFLTIAGLVSFVILLSVEGAP